MERAGYPRCLHTHTHTYKRAQKRRRTGTQANPGRRRFAAHSALKKHARHAGQCGRCFAALRTRPFLVLGEGGERCVQRFRFYSSPVTLLSATTASRVEGWCVEVVGRKHL